MRISVGPAPSHWGTKKLESFYRKIARSPADRVYLGETICPERSCFSPRFLDSICKKLIRAGMEVYASSLILVKNREEYSAFKDVARRVQGIEVNSPAFLELASCYPAVSGMFLNVYNSVAADILAKHKVRGVVLPCELSLESITSIAKTCSVKTEVIVHGYMPIAISGACLTVRSHGENGNGCGEVCRRYPEGMVLAADDRPLFRIEGPQTTSAATCCLVEYLPQLEKAGVDTVRILPQWNHTGRIVEIYRDVLNHRKHCEDARKELAALSPTGMCNGWFLGKAGWFDGSQSETPPASIATGFRPASLSKKRVNEEAAPSSYYVEDIAKRDSSRTRSDNDIISKVDRLIKIVNRDPEFIKQVAEFKGTTLVISATDTGRELMIELNEQGVRAHLYTGGDFQVKIEATEQVHWAVLTGQMDTDAAFFAGKVRIRGSIATAFSIKNRFLGLLQSHSAHWPSREATIKTGV